MYGKVRPGGCFVVCFSILFLFVCVCVCVCVYVCVCWGGSGRGCALLLRIVMVGFFILSVAEIHLVELPMGNDDGN